MKVKDIDLKHFTIQLERVGSLINTTVIRIRSKPEYVDNYKDSHGEPIKLSFTLQTNMHLRFTEKTKKVILSFLPREEIYRLKDSIAYRLSNIIKERDIQLYSTQNEILANETSKHKENKELNLSELEANKTSLADENKVNLDDLFSGDFDFSELDINDTGVTEEVVETADFDFEEPDVKPETNLETPINDFNFDFDDDDVLVTTAPKKTIKDVVTNYNLKDDLSNEEEIMKTLPYFYLLHRGYRLTIDFNRKTFSASGDNQNIVNSLHHLATLIFINYDFLTSEKHPEWLYSGLKDDVTAIFEKIVNLNHDTLTGMEESIGIIESGIYSALLNYRNILGYFNHHKPLAIEHE